MPGLLYAPLVSRTALSMTGEDTHGFLNNLITVNMEKVDQTGVGYGGLLTPQGKILFDFFVMPQEGGYLFECAASQKDELIKRLTFYKLRAKIEINDLSTSHTVIAIWGDGVPENAGFTDPRTPEAGARLIGPACDSEDAFGASKASENAYHAHRIALGLADSDSDIGSGEVFPHEANFDQFGGVDFTKGCYVGQEVVSRMEHRATARKRMVPFTFDGPAPAIGTPVTGNGKAIGTLSSVSSDHGLALLRLDRVKETYDSGGELTADGTNITPYKPDWAGFDMPERKLPNGRRRQNST
jgi:folate-binding protein YgfZ